MQPLHSRRPPHGQWTFLSPPAEDQKEYLEGELKAWRGSEYHIPNTWEFAVH
jgi:hypothetical protein